jgi:hypothetical protein
MGRAVPPLERRVMRGACVWLPLVLLFGPGPAQSAADEFYKGKTVTLVVANAAGGSSRQKPPSVGWAEACSAVPTNCPSAWARRCAPLPTLQD